MNNDNNDSEVFWDYSGMILGVFWDYSGSILTIFCDYSGGILAVFYGSNLAIFWNYSGSILGVFWEYSGNISDYSGSILAVFWEKSASIPSQRVNLKNWRAFRRRALNLNISEHPVTEGEIEKLASNTSQRAKFTN